MKALLTELYHGETRRGKHFRFSILVFDLVIISYFVVTSILEDTPQIGIIDLVMAFIIALDYMARVYVSKHRLKSAFRFSSLADLVVIASLIVPFFLSNLAFLRVTRMLRLFRSYHVLKELRARFHWFADHEEVVQSGLNLWVFVFVVTAIVYVQQVGNNPAITSYIDALYFTVSTLTTTGFGDIIMIDNSGKIMAVIIMVFGVGLFLRLVQTIFRPLKVVHLCNTCGLSRHEPDAVHCKHCGNLLSIPTKGEWH